MWEALVGQWEVETNTAPSPALLPVFLRDPSKGTLALSAHTTQRLGDGQGAVRPDLAKQTPVGCVLASADSLLFPAFVKS